MDEPQYHVEPPWDGMAQVRWWPNAYDFDELRDFAAEVEAADAPTLLTDKDSGRVKFVAMTPTAYDRLLDCSPGWWPPRDAMPCVAWEPDGDNDEMHRFVARVEAADGPVLLADRDTGRSIFVAVVPARYKAHQFP